LPRGYRKMRGEEQISFRDSRAGKIRGGDWVRGITRGRDANSLQGTALSRDSEYAELWRRIAAGS